MKKLTVFWFRRDLRLNDNKGLYEALIGGNKVLPVFIFDTDITSKLNKDDARLTFIYNALSGINNHEGEQVPGRTLSGHSQRCYKKNNQKFSNRKSDRKSRL